MAIDKVMIRRHSDDTDMYEIYTQHKVSFILWAVVHEDILGYFGLCSEDIENMERELIIKPESV